MNHRQKKITTQSMNVACATAKDQQQKKERKELYTALSWQKCSHGLNDTATTAIQIFFFVMNIPLKTNPVPTADAHYPNYSRAKNFTRLKTAKLLAE